MGTELSKQIAEGEDGWAASDLAASVPPGIAQQQQCEATGSTTITTATAVAQWHAWLRETESLYVKGRIKDCREVCVCVAMYMAVALSPCGSQVSAIVLPAWQHLVGAEHILAENFCAPIFKICSPFSRLHSKQQAAVHTQARILLYQTKTMYSYCCTTAAAARSLDDCLCIHFVQAPCSTLNYPYVHPGVLPPTSLPGTWYLPCSAQPPLNSSIIVL